MSKIITAFLAGIAIGVLIAPRKGSETRKKIIDEASSVKDEFSDLVKGAAESIKSGLAAADEKANDLLKKAKEGWEGFGKRAV
ncbi:MAG TPA: YtxH domain-containing protein [Puia sp.]|nr:YtxH domain-containing protein [Puia sp.]